MTSLDIVDNNTIAINNSNSSITKNQVLDNLTAKVDAHLAKLNANKLDESNPFAKFVG